MSYDVSIDSYMVKSRKDSLVRDLSDKYFGLKDSLESYFPSNYKVYLNSFAENLVTQKLYFEKLTSEKKLSPLSSASNSFLLAYSFILSNNRFENISVSSKSNINFNSNISSFQKILVDDFKQFSSYNNSDSLVLNYFSSISAKAHDFLTSSDNSDLYLSLISSSNKNFSNLSTGSIIGNKEFVSTIDETLKLLFLYDLHSKSHPHILRYGDFNQRIMGFGLPGCGKSHTLEVMISQAKDMSKKYSKPLIVRDISNSLKSKYFSESANNISRLFSQVSKGDAIYFLTADDIDTVVFGRSDNESSENISVLGELINQIQGVSSNNLGNYILVATTNRPDVLDDALFRRFQKKVLVNGPETIKDYSDLLKLKLNSYVADGLVKITNWDYFGKQFYRQKSSGSVVSDFASSISNIILSSSFSEELYSLSADVVSKRLKDSYSKVSESKLKQSLDTFLENIKQ